MFNEEFIKSVKNFGIFLFIYTLVFVLFFSTISYTFPFVAAFFIAFLIQPVTRFFREKLKMAKNMTSLVSSALVFVIFFTLTFLLFYKITFEARLLVQNIPYFNINIILNPLRDLVDEAGLYFEKIDPNFIERNSNQISQIITRGLDVVGKSLNTFLSVAASIPVWITVLFIVVLSTYFFSRDMTQIKNSIKSVFSSEGREKFAKVWYEGIRMLTQYIKAYCLIYFLTFVQTLIGFSIFRVKYTVILSIVCAIGDILPVLGIAVVYLPLIAIYYFTGNYFTAAGLLILFILISVIRQIVEPKIVSKSLGIHPVITLAAIFIGLKSYGFLGMIYLTFLVICYKVLKTAGVV